MLHIYILVYILNSTCLSEKSHKAILSISCFRIPMLTKYKLSDTGSPKKQWRKGLFRAFTAILLALLALQLLYELVLRSTDTALDYWSRSAAYVEEHKPEVLFFGASVGVYAIRHDEMGAAYYNMSLFSERPNFHYPKFLSLLKRDNNIKAIVIPAEYLSLHRWGREFHSILPMADFGIISQTLSIDPWYRENRILRNIESSILHFFPVLQDAQRKRLLSRLLANIQNTLIPVETINKGFSDCMTLQVPKEGFRREQPLNEREAEKVEALIKDYFQTTVVEMSFDERTAHVWKQMIDTAHEHGIKVIGIQHPAYRFGPMRKSHVDERAEAFLKEAGYDAIINNGTLFDNKPEYFHDPVHLSTAGAQAYAPILKRQIEAIVPGLSRKPFECGNLGKKFSKMPGWPYSPAFSF